MLEFSIHRNGSDLTLELPIPTDVLAGELRMLGFEKTMNHITQDEFALRPTNELGEHFMRLVQPDDTLHRIATFCNVPGSLTDIPLIQLSDLIMTDRFRDLDHMADYLQYGPAALDVAEPQKPDCPLIGQDGNVFNLIGIAAKTLRENGLADQAKEMTQRAFDSGSYDQALGVIMEYVNVTSVYDDMDEDEDWCREPEYDEEPGFGGMGDCLNAQQCNQHPAF